MAFTPQEKVRIRHHLGYLNVTNAATFALGVPQAVETQFIIENAMNLVLPEAEVEVRRLVGVLDQLEEQMVCDHELLAVEAIGEVKVRADEQQQLTKRYVYWQHALANVLGCNPNPFDRRFTQSGGVNAPVNH